MKRTEPTPESSKRSARDKRRRQRLQEAGLCDCGRAPHVEGRAKCQACIDRGCKVYRASKRVGRCPCGKAARPYKALCVTCVEARRNRSRQRSAERRAAGLCITCGKQPAAQGGRCVECRARHSAHCAKAQNPTRREREQNGRCIECNGPNLKATHARCDECRKAASIKARALRDSRIAEGLCPRCGKHKVGPRTAKTGIVACLPCRRHRRALGHG